MSKHVLLKMGSGTVYAGFNDISVQVWADTSPGPSHQYGGSLPPNPELAACYQQWREQYCYAWPQDNTRMFVLPPDVSHFSITEFQDLCQHLEDLINEWLSTDDFRIRVDQPLRKCLNPNDEIQVILESSDHDLVRRLPLHRWHFFEDFPKAELVISEREWRTINPSQTPPGIVRILAIFGDKTGLNLGNERNFLLQLDGAEVCFLDEPKHEELAQSLTNEPWDILFFAGHSQTQEQTGLIKLNSGQSLSIKELRYELNIAIANGLQLAIFNSCDGLGIAKQLGQLNIPNVIVMREQILDHLAQTFLKHMLGNLSAGLPLYLAVKEARQSLYLIKEFPCAHWLPVILQNPTARVTTWEKLRFPQGIRKPKVKKLLAMTIFINALVLCLRSLGMLQSLELIGYDYLHQHPLNKEHQDKNIFVIEITSNDLNRKKSGDVGSESISDATLLRLLKILKKAKVRTIGSDILRPEINNPMDTNLKNYIQNMDNFFVICRDGSLIENKLQAKVSSPNSVNKRFHTFSNVPLDPDFVVRRQKLSRDQVYPEACHSRNSLNSYVAQDFLEHEIYPQSGRGRVFKLTKNRKQYHIQGNVIPRIGSFQGENHLEKFLLSRRGPYQSTKIDLRGTQLLLKYRYRDSIRNSFDSSSLAEVMSENFDLETINDRIVLIGRNDDQSDLFQTPFQGKNTRRKEIPGVYLHAHMASQIIEFNYGRNLLNVLPMWGEILWVWISTTIGGFILWLTQRHQVLNYICGFVFMTCIYFGSLGLFLNGLWVPLIPILVSFIILEVFILFI